MCAWLTLTQAASGLSHAGKSELVSEHQGKAELSRAALPSSGLFSWNWCKWLLESVRDGEEENNWPCPTGSFPCTGRAAGYRLLNPKISQISSQIKFVHPGTCHAKGAYFPGFFWLHLACCTFPLGSLTRCSPQSVISCTPVIYHSNSFGLCSRRCSRIYKSNKTLLWSHHKWNFHFI